MEDLFKALVQLGMFSAFIHAIIEVVKGISTIGLWGIVKGLFLTLVRDEPLKPEAIRTGVFALALLYCWGFDYDAMTEILKVEIAENNQLGWWLAYVGTASVVYVGVDVFYQWVKNVTSKLKPDGEQKP